jgi:predicted AlkP superfamily phosphohydrolase/phosphomutase
VIGVDGATFDLVEPWVSQGKLPHFRHLMESGAWGRLQSTIPPLTPCAWTSFKTGVNPGKHGVYEFYFLDENRDLQVNFHRNRGYDSIWRILSNHGLRSCVYNVPFTFPPEEVHGILISGLLTPSTAANFTYPSEFKKELLRNIPDYRIFPATRYSEREDDIEAFYRDLLELIEVRFRTARYLLERERWDFFMMVFNETDYVQHWFWKYIDPAHPDYTEELNRKFGDRIYQIYARIDDHLGRFLEFGNSGTLFLVMSDHGAGLFRKRIYINNWLKAQGYLKLKSTPKVLLKRLFYRIGIHPQTAINMAYRLGLARLNQKVSFGQKKAIFSKIGYTFEDVDWRRTKAFSFGCYGPIYINSSGNRLDGIVPEEEVPALREEIVARLKEIVDPERGVKLVDRIWEREELYHGPSTRFLPDVAYSLDDFSYTSSSLFAMPSNDIFSAPLTRKSGDHRLHGILLAGGNRVRSGLELDRANIMDLAPTILRYLGLEIPEEMDGQALDGIFR